MAFSKTVRNWSQGGKKKFRLGVVTSIWTTRKLNQGLQCSFLGVKCFLDIKEKENKIWRRKTLQKLWRKYGIIMMPQQATRRLNGWVGPPAPEGTLCYHQEKKGLSNLWLLTAPSPQPGDAYFLFYKCFYSISTKSFGL